LPLAGIASLDPQAAFFVFYRQFLVLRVELLLADIARIQLAFQFDVATVRFPEIHLALAKIHP
jgi:hypothetical protein